MLAIDNVARAKVGSAFNHHKYTFFVGHCKVPTHCCPYLALVEIFRAKLFAYLHTYRNVSFSYYSPG